MSKVTLFGNLQAPVQALVRPSQWLPCLRRLHSYKEIWRMDGTRQEVCKAVISGVEKLKEQGYNHECFDIHKVDEESGFVRVFAFTRAEWLDVIEIQYKEGWIEAYSFSSGLVPLIVPFACLCNLMCFYAPFLDMDFNRNRLASLREAIPGSVQLAEDTA